MCEINKEKVTCITNIPQETQGVQPKFKKNHLYKTFLEYTIKH